MKNALRQKMQGLSRQLNLAHIKSEKFYASEYNFGEKIKMLDFFEMALAFDNEDLIMNKIEMLRTEMFPAESNSKIKKYLQDQITDLTYKIECWQSRKFPKK
jgi:methyl coenzyme M reductase subunit D